MKGLKSVLAVVSALILMSGCSSAFYATVNAGDGMYGVHDKIAIANQQREKAELQRAEAEARRAEWEARLAEAQARAAEEEYYNGVNYSTVVADTYESAYARRLRGFSSPTYRLPSSYYDLRYDNSYSYVTAYDPAFYNIMVSGDQVWVEPKYISSMFGTWGATNVTIAVGSWYYGWESPYYYYGYGAWWGYPRYSWWDWNWGICYNPYYSWWGCGWGSPWYYHHHHHHAIHGPGYHHTHHGVGMPPHHKPAHGNKPPHREQIVDKPSYTSPSSGKNYGNRQPARGTVNGSGVFDRQTSQGGNTSRPGSTAPSGVISRGSLGVRSGSSSTKVNGTTTQPNRGSSSSSSSSASRNRGGVSSFFNQSSSESTGRTIRSNVDPWGSSRSSSSSSSSSSSGGYSSGSSSGGGSGGGHRGGNSLGR